jgi:integrase
VRRTIEKKEIPQTKGRKEIPMKNKAGSVSKYSTKGGDRLWRYRFDADPMDGKRQIISKQGFETRGTATKALQVAIEEYQWSKTLPVTPPPTPPQRETVGDWVRTWLRDYAPHQCQPKTLERYHGLAGYILSAKEGEPAALAATPLVDLKHTTVEAALYALLRMPAKRRKHLAPKSIREIAGVLSVSLNEAFRLDKIPVNPLLKVKLPKVERTEARALTQEEMDRLREVCRGDWTLTFIDISLATGARRGELLALEWPDIEWLTATLMVSKSLEQTKAGLRVKRPKGGRVRKFRLGQTAIASLRFLHEQQRENRKLLDSDYQGQLVFCQPDGAPLRPDLVSQTIVRRLKKAKIKSASLHTLRHTLASHLLSNGVPLPVVSARLGHADVNITARIYSHMLPDDDARAADTWEKIVTPVQ